MEAQHIACSSEQKAVIAPIIERLNASGRVLFEPHYYQDEDVVQYVLGRDFGILCPKSALSLQKLEELWEERHGYSEGSIFSDAVSFGWTPVVFFVSPQFAEKHRVLDVPFGWNSLLNLAKNGKVRIRHASHLGQDGFGVAVAQHIAFPSRTGEEEQPPGEMVSLEQAVQEYGPDDNEVIRRAVVEGDWTTDVVIAQERPIILSALAAMFLTAIGLRPALGLLPLAAYL